MALITKWEEIKKLTGVVSKKIYSSYIQGKSSYTMMVGNLRQIEKEIYTYW